MALKIVVDGYNLLYCSGIWQYTGNHDITLARAELLRSLSQYKKHKKHSILVVFDGDKGGWPTEQRERIKGIEVIYSRNGEQADDVIARLAENLRESATVVTSDRELTDRVTCFGATVIPVDQFEAKLRSKHQMDKFDEPDDDGDRPITTKKKGPAYRRPKRHRKRHARLNKL